MNPEQIQAKVEFFLQKYNSVQLLKEELGEAEEELILLSKVLSKDLHVFRGEPIFVDSSELGKVTVTVNEEWQECKKNLIAINHLTSLDTIGRLLSSEETER